MEEVWWAVGLVWEGSYQEPGTDPVERPIPPHPPYPISIKQECISALEERRRVQKSSIKPRNDRAKPHCITEANRLSSQECTFWTRIETYNAREPKAAVAEATWEQDRRTWRQEQPEVIYKVSICKALLSSSAQEGGQSAGLLKYNSWRPGRSLQNGTHSSLNVSGQPSV